MWVAYALLLYNSADKLASSFRKVSVQILLVVLYSLTGTMDSARAQVFGSRSKSVVQTLPPKRVWERFRRRSILNGLRKKIVNIPRNPKKIMSVPGCRRNIFNNLDFSNKIKNLLVCQFIFTTTVKIL